MGTVQALVSVAGQGNVTALSSTRRPTSVLRLCYDSQFAVMLPAILPDRFSGLTYDETDRRIRDARAALGQRLVILSHHYQRDEVIRFADARGDSFKLAQWAANRKEAEYTVFCSVHFM